MDTGNQSWKQELYWAAGFMEGEGSFSCNKKTKALRLQAPQKERSPLDRLHRFLGGRIYHRINRGYPIFYWETTGSHAAGICMTLYLLLSERRQGQIKQALAEWKTRRPHKKDWTHCKFGHEFTEGNTYRHPVTGSRKCRICIRKRNAGYEKKKREAEGGVPRAKINEFEVKEIRNLFAGGISQAELCRRYGLTPGTMHHIVHRITWKDVT